MRASPVSRLRGALTAFGGGTEQPGARTLLSPRPAARQPHSHIALARGSAKQWGLLAPKLLGVAQKPLQGSAQQWVAPKPPLAPAAALARASTTRQVAAAGAGAAGGGLSLSTVAVAPWYTRGIRPGTVSPAALGQGQTEIRGAQGPQAGGRLQLMRMRQPPWPHYSTVPGRGPGPLRQSACTLLSQSIKHSFPRRSNLGKCSSCSSVITVSSSSRSHRIPLPTATQSQALLFTDVITTSPRAPCSSRATINTSLTTAVKRYNSALSAPFALGQTMTEEGQSRGPESSPGTGPGAREPRDSASAEGYTGSVSVAALSLGPETGGPSGASSGITQSTPPVAASVSVSASPSPSGTTPVSASASGPETPPATSSSSTLAPGATNTAAPGNGAAGSERPPATSSSSSTATAAPGDGAPGTPPADPIVQHVVMRRDLADKEKEGLGWPLGSVIAQGCHASVAAIWEFRGEPLAQRYMADLDNMRKVVLEVKNETQLRELSKKLTAGGIPHKLWIEQPENIATCLATQPNLKSIAAPYFKKLKLCK